MKPYRPTKLKIGTMALAGTLLIAACGYSPATQNPSYPTATRTKGTATQGQATLKFKLGSLNGYGVQAVSPYTKASVNHLTIQIFLLSNGTETPVVDGNQQPVSIDLLNSEFDDSITFGNLTLGDTYRIKCFAYKAAGTDAADLISTQDANSYTDIVADEASQSTVFTLKVRLIDVVGTGNATATIEITDGGIIPGGPVTIIKHPKPTPTPAGPASLQTSVQDTTLTFTWSGIDVSTLVDGQAPNQIRIEDAFGNELGHYAIAGSGTGTKYNPPKGTDYPVYVRAAVYGTGSNAGMLLAKGPSQAVAYVTYDGSPIMIDTSSEYEIAVYGADFHTPIFGTNPLGVQLYIKTKNGVPDGTVLFSGQSSNFVVPKNPLGSGTFELGVRTYGDNSGAPVYGSDQATVTLSM